MEKEFTVANISTDSVEKIAALEQELSAQNQENIVLIAYTNNETKEK